MARPVYSRVGCAQCQSCCYDAGDGRQDAAQGARQQLKATSVWCPRARLAYVSVSCTYRAKCSRKRIEYLCLVVWYSPKKDCSHRSVAN